MLCSRFTPRSVFCILSSPALFSKRVGPMMMMVLLHLPRTFPARLASIGVLTPSSASPSQLPESCVVEDTGLALGHRRLSETMVVRGFCWNLRDWRLSVRAGLSDEAEPLSDQPRIEKRCGGAACLSRSPRNAAQYPPELDIPVHPICSAPHCPRVARVGFNAIAPD